jgi:hypothetical protein
MKFLASWLQRLFRSEVALYLTLGAMAAGALNLATAKVKLRQQEQVLHSEVSRALEGWFETLLSRQSETVGLWLDPEFQALLANGQVLDRNGFLRLRMPLAQGSPRLRLIKATRHDDTAVATFMLILDEGVDVRVLSAATPIMVVFHIDDEQWKLVSLIQGTRGLTGT